MISLLRRFLDWLEARFPAKVVVKRVDYEALRKRIDDLHMRADLDLRDTRKSLNELNQQIIIPHIEKIATLEKSVAAIKDVLARGQVPVIQSKEWLRDQFIKGEFQRGPERSSVEAKG